MFFLSNKFLDFIRTHIIIIKDSYTFLGHQNKGNNNILFRRSWVDLWILARNVVNYDHDYVYLGLLISVSGSRPGIPLLFLMPTFGLTSLISSKFLFSASFCAQRLVEL